MLVRWVLDYVAAWKSLLLDHNVGEFLAVYRARRAFRRWRKDFAADRNKIQAGRSAASLEDVCRFSVLWQYYAKGRRRYSDFF